MLTLPIALVCATLYVANANISSDASTFSLQNLVNTIKVALGIPIARLYSYILSLALTEVRAERKNSQRCRCRCLRYEEVTDAVGGTHIVYTIFIVCHFLAGTGQSPAEIIMGDILLQ